MVIIKISLTVVAIFLVATSKVSSAPPIARLGCPDSCGDIKIPYPFGIREKCSLSSEFEIRCDTTPHTPIIGADVGISDISMESGELRILQYSAQSCTNQSGDEVRTIVSVLSAGSFSISSEKNKLIATGCDTFGIVNGSRNGIQHTIGCVSICSNTTHLTTNNDTSCDGVGCCQMEIPDGLTNVQVSANTLTNHTDTMDFNNCSFATLVEKDWFNFSTKYYYEFPPMVPLVLDWGLGNETCGDKPNCLCGEHSKMEVSSKNNSQYHCKCLEGFEGNPYLHCQDIDECKEKNGNCGLHSTCENIDGSFTCKCIKGYKKDGENCIPVQHIKLYPIWIGVGVLVLVIAASWSYLGYRKWKFIKLKEKFFQQNGGFLLQQKLSNHEGPSRSRVMAKIFTQEELEKATDNYDRSKIVGIGGFGTVYKGVLADGITVAIKKSKIIDESQTEQFVNEVLVLSQINHRNVVRLLGCCLETEVPLLVYEFVTNGTLSDHIHNKSKSLKLSWDARLRIAAETAGVLAYLHSSAATPIIHRDVKSANVLLDNSYTAKVSDFGASRLVPLDQTQLSTIVQGTFGYLDPEYFQTNQLTDKSDVYSFGVVLIELMTGMKAICFDKPEEERNLAKNFLVALKEDRLEEIVEDCVVKNTSIKHLKEVAYLAGSCLSIKGEERPSMKDVAMELEGLRISINHSWIVDESYLEETDQLISEKFANSSINDIDASYSGMTDRVLFPARDGR